MVTTCWTRWTLTIAVLVTLMAPACDWSRKDESKKERKAERKEEKKERQASGDNREPAGRARDQPAGRDWTRNPAVVQISTSEDVYGLGDVHGGYDRLVSLLLSAGLIERSKQGGGSYDWSGGRRVLISVGDVIDKGDQSLASIDLLIALESKAAAAGGRVVVTLGNHEAEFLADSRNKKAKHDFDKELKARNVDPEDVASGRGRYGEWLLQRPLAAKVNGWLFAHAGNPGGMTLTALSDAYQKSVDAGDWSADFVTGKDSILEAQKWWKTSDLDADLRAVGARHIVFGHDPGALDQPGHIAQKFDGKLFLIDVGMSPAVDYSPGALLLIHTSGSAEEVTSVDASGARVSLWRGAR